ncbi:MAG TPA: DUF4097 family beta strand repeat-containing protein [Terriglobia bacterium]|nr:DUF4097 family beta strand repeat-containing protein [Terriglobia bacterium]
MKRIHFLLFCTPGLLLSLAGGAQASTQIEKNLKLAPGGTLYVDTSGGDVIVKGTSESGARVVVTTNLSDLESIFDLRFEEQPHAVQIVAHRRSDAPWPHHFTLKFEISVPRQTSLELKTGGGDVRATDLEGTFHLKTSGGDVEASDVKGDLDGETSGGDMRIRQLSGNLVLHTSGGDIQAEGISGRVDVHTSGGDVEVSLMRGNAQGGEVETSGGEIDVALDPVVNLDLEATAGSGDVDSDLHTTTTSTLSPSNLRATLGKGGQLLRLHTTGGDIHLQPL